MADGFVGETVTLHPVAKGPKDAHGNRQDVALRPVELADVLCAPGDAEDAIEDGIPDGAHVAWTLYVPAAQADQRWRGGRVDVRGDLYDVVGDPKPWADSPTSYSIAVKVMAYE